MSTLGYSIMVLLLSLGTSADAQDAIGVHMANGFKIGEVTGDSALVWTRLTRRPERLGDGVPFGPDADSVPEGLELGDMEDSVEGAPGQVQVSWWPRGAVGIRAATGWTPVDPDRDHTAQLTLGGLRPGVHYEILVEGRSGDEGAAECSLFGSFTSPEAPDVSQRVLFTVVTGQEFARRDDPGNGHRIYPRMSDLEPDFFVHTGDIEYYDKAGPYARTLELARFKWNRIYSMAFQRDFHRNVASYFIKDDHDTLKNDCWPGQTYGDITWEEGVALFREQVPMGDRTWRRVRWGKDLEIWLVEGRDFRSANNTPDGPEKTIWGREQLEWFQRTFAASDATFRVLISPTPIVGPDRAGKNDNHANAGFATEGAQLRAFLGAQQDAFVICGDRHWQYLSVDPKTGVHEYSCGPTTDVHAGGFRDEDRSDMHRFLRIKGGFLSVVVDRESNEPRIRFRHHGVDGATVNDQAYSATAELP